MDEELYVEALDDPDVLDQVRLGALTVAVRIVADRVVMVLGFVFNDTFTIDPRFAELNLSALEALHLASALAGAAATAARDDTDTPQGFA